MSNRVTFWGSMVFAFLSYTGLTLGIPIANAQIFRPSLTVLEENRFIPLLLEEISCSTFLQPYFDWERGSFLNFVTASVVFNNVENNLVTYTTGTLNLNGNNLVGNFTKLLSNRFYPFPIEVGGGFGGSGSLQPFSIREPASVNITLAADGSLTWVEQSFNNATSRYQAVCYSNKTAILLPIFNTDQAAGVITFGTGTGPR